MTPSEKDRAIHELAIELADKCAASEIRRVGHITVNKGWYNITAGDDCEVKLLARSARYLDLRGLLERQPDQSNLVRPLPEEEDTYDLPF